MRGPSLFMSQWLCNGSVRYWKGRGECVVIQYCTSALPAAHRDHCLAGLWLSRNWRVGRHYTNKGVFTSARSSRGFGPPFSSGPSSGAHRWVGKLGAYSALCSSSVDKSNSHRRPAPTLSPPAFYRPPSHFHYCFYLILQPISSPTRPPSLQPLQTTSCLCWSIDPHSCVSVASLWARLCEIGLLIRWRWVAEM